MNEWGLSPMGKLPGDQRGAVDGRGALEDVDDLVGLAGIDASSGMPGIGTVGTAAAQLIQPPRPLLAAPELEPPAGPLEVDGDNDRGEDEDGVGDFTGAQHTGRD